MTIYTTTLCHLLFIQKYNLYIKIIKGTVAEI